MTPVAVVTGVDGGIGAATARTLAGAGYRVVGVDRGVVGKKRRQAVSHYLQADLALPSEVTRLCTRIAAELPVLDLLVNNAAVQLAGPVEETSVEQWDEVMAVNLRAPFLLVRHLVHCLASGRGGAVVNVASVHAIASSTGIAAYAASKGGLAALTRALAVELAPRRVRVNAVLPGAIDTTMLDAGLRRGHLRGNDLDRLKAELGTRTVAGRIGRPEEIAEAVLFLADPERSGFVTGQQLVVDGGATARLSTE